jgi:hypothetical protein
MVLSKLAEEGIQSRVEPAVHMFRWSISMVANFATVQLGNHKRYTAQEPQI